MKATEDNEPVIKSRAWKGALRAGMVSVGLVQRKGTTYSWLMYTPNSPNARKHSGLSLTLVFVSVSFDCFGLKNASRLANVTNTICENMPVRGRLPGAPWSVDKHLERKASELCCRLLFFLFTQLRGGVQVCKGEREKKISLLASCE